MTDENINRKLILLHSHCLRLNKFVQILSYSTEIWYIHRHFSSKNKLLSVNELFFLHRMKLHRFSARWCKWCAELHYLWRNPKRRFVSGITQTDEICLIHYGTFQWSHFLLYCATVPLPSRLWPCLYCIYSFSTHWRSYYSVIKWSVRLRFSKSTHS